jgi:hypothetical protein
MRLSLRNQVHKLSATSARDNIPINIQTCSSTRFAWRNWAMTWGSEQALAFLPGAF